MDFFDYAADEKIDGWSSKTENYGAASIIRTRVGDSLYVEFRFSGADQDRCKGDAGDAGWAEKP